MRKAISLVFAIAVLCIATSAMAMPEVDSDGVTGGRSVTTFYTGAVSGTSSVRRTTPMPGFRPGDTIHFTVTNLTNGKELTVISYKLGATPSDSTVQYINQYTISGDNPISYTIRDLASGIYCLKMTDSNDGNVATFYYKVGKVSANVTIPDDGSAYVMESFDGGTTYSIGFIGKATISSSEVGFGDIGAEVGFVFSDSTAGGTNVTNAPKTISGSSLDTYFTGLLSANPGIELNGSFSVIYGVTMFNVPASHKDNITASAYVNN